MDREEENTYLNFSKTMKNLFYKLGGKEEMKAKKLLAMGLTVLIGTASTSSMLCNTVFAQENTHIEESTDLDETLDTTENISPKLTDNHDITSTVNAMANTAGTSADNPLVIPEEGLLWDGNGSTVLKGVNSEWYKTNVTDAGVQFVAIKIPEKTTEIYASVFSPNIYASGTPTTGGSSVKIANIVDKLVAVDFSAATNLTKINKQVFYDAKKLGGVIDLRNTKITEIGGNTFNGTAITGVILPSTLTSIGSLDSNMAVFGNCSNLAFIGMRDAVGDENFLELPQSLTTIGKYAFSFSGSSPIYQKMKNDGLVVSIPASVTTIKASAFSNSQCSKNIFVLEVASSFEGADKDAFSNSTWESNRPTVLFPNFSTYQNADETKKNAMASYANLSYGVTLNFVYNGLSIATEQKLYNNTVQYVKKNGVWSLDEHYELPKPTGVPTPAAGYYGGWELDGKELTADSQISVTSPADTLTVTWKNDFVSEPNVEYSMNGQPISQSSPYNVQRFGTIGVQVTHPLMKNENTNESTDTYVEFEYYWFDIQNGTVGERSKATGTEDYFYRESTQNVPTTVSEIPMRTEADTRTGGTNYYCVQVLGKLVVNGVPQSGYYYKSLVPIISFGGHPINNNATTDKDYIFNVNVVPAQFTVNFDSQGGSIVAEQSVEYDNLIQEPTVPTKEGYTFAGWYKEAACQNKWDFATEKMPANAVTLYAKWEANAYSVGFNANGGTGTMSEQAFVYDTAQGLETNKFTKEGYTFKGWSTTTDGQVVYADGESVKNLTSVPNETVTLYAVWEANAYSVEFNANSGTGTMPSQAFVYDTAQALETNRFTKEGYTFKGWSTIVNGQVMYTDGATVNNLTATNHDTVTLYAVWEANQYTVTFKDWDGSVLKTEQVAYNTAATAPAAPTREGYRFTGWDKTFDVITGDTEITAQYIKTWTVTFKDEDGTVLKTEIVDEGTGATAPTEPAKEGHTFAGWNAAFDNVTEDTVVTATYTVNQYTVTFKDWDGSVLKTEQVAYNTGASAPTEPNREGYRFTGWDVSFENIMGDTIVTAQYEKEESIVPPTEPEQPQAPGQGGEMNNTEIKTQTGANLEAAKTGDDFIVEPLLVTGGISSIAAAIAFFFRKKKKLNHKEK